MFYTIAIIIDALQNFLEIVFAAVGLIPPITYESDSDSDDDTPDGMYT